ncbi:MAG: hypothetical protein E7266_06285 [Lachnospiraceae bacterium]|nr:hypothetical protein [Lachnospiraceae bacterium]
MDIIIKKRDAYFCNLKAVLILLVVYGHLIEPEMGKFDIVMALYKFIYMVHMPLFVFLSGYFTVNGKTAVKQAKKILITYIILQSSIMVAVNYLHIEIYVGNTPINYVSFTTPFWHLWYLISLACWSMAGSVILFLDERYRILKRSSMKVFIIVISVIVGCLAGMMPYIGRELSLSRTLVFMPYFLGGMFIPKNIQWHKYKKRGIIALALGLILFIGSYETIDYSFLWQRSPYGDDMYTGILCRGLCYITAVLLGFFVITHMPGRRCFFSKIGADTMNIYLWHPFIIMLMNGVGISENLFIFLAFPISMMIIYLIYMLFKWNSGLYGIFHSKT